MLEQLHNSKILICDDSVTNVMIVSSILKEDGFKNLTNTTSPEEAVKLMRDRSFDMLLLDIEMPVMTGLQILDLLRAENIVDEYFPVIMLTGHKDQKTRNMALHKGACDYITKPLDETEIVLRVSNTLKVRSAIRLNTSLATKLASQLEQKDQQLQDAEKLLVQRLALASELKDKSTGKHVIRVGKFAGLLAELAGFSPQIAEMIALTAPLHDIGKLAIPDKILLKNGELDNDEWDCMRTHAQIGADLLYHKDSYLAQMASTIALNHHEKWDGTGYPNGLKGEEIPVEGRVTAIADIFDALTTKRPYKEAWCISDAVKELESLAGNHLDPSLVNLFISNLDKMIEIKDKYSGLSD